MAGEILRFPARDSAGSRPRPSNHQLSHKNYSLAVAGLLLLKRLLQILAGFVQGALGVVVGLQGLAVLVGGAFALSGDVEDLAYLDMTPDFCPARFAIAIQALAIG